MPGHKGEDGMAVKRPTPAQLRDIGAELGIDLSDADLEAYMPLVQSLAGWL